MPSFHKGASGSQMHNQPLVHTQLPVKTRRSRPRATVRPFGGRVFGLRGPPSRTRFYHSHPFGKRIGDGWLDEIELSFSFQLGQPIEMAAIRCRRPRTGRSANGPAADCPLSLPFRPIVPEGEARWDISSTILRCRSAKLGMLAGTSLARSSALFRHPTHLFATNLRFRSHKRSYRRGHRAVVARHSSRSLAGLRMACRARSEGPRTVRTPVSPRRPR